MIILNYLRTFIGILVFINMMLVGAIYYTFIFWIKKDKKEALLHTFAYNHFITRWWSAIVGIKYEFFNTQVLNKLNEKPCIVVCNHCGMIDIITVNVALNHIYTPLAKIEVAKIPLLGTMFKKVCVFVDRSNEASRKRSLEELRKNGKEGISVFIFPEGTRNKAGEHPLLPFKKGAFQLALELQWDIIYFVVEGAHHALPHDKLPINPLTLNVEYQFFSTKGIENTPENIEKIKQTIYTEMEKLIIKHRQNRTN